MLHMCISQHHGIAITIDKIPSDASPIGLTSLETTNSQGAFESIFSSHINYDGTEISSDNRSHKSDQIFFNNSDVSTYISSSDAQGAIEDVLRNSLGQTDVHQNLFHSNAVEKSSIIVDPKSSGVGKTLIVSSLITYSESPKSSDSEVSIISFITPANLPTIAIKRSDIIRVTDGSKVTDYQISDVIYSGDGLSIDGVSVYGRLLSDSNDGVTGEVFRNINSESNFSGLLLSAREYQSSDGTSFSNADIIQVSNPNSTSILTDGCRPRELSITNRFISIKVDNGSSIELDLYDGGLAAESISQNINSIIKALNFLKTD